MSGEARRAGVGLVLEARGRGPSFIAELAPGGSADRSGRVRVGDQLLRVDGQLVQGMTPSELSQIISGPEGTAVRLAFRRVTSNFFAENEDNFEVSLVRSVPQALASARYLPPQSQPLLPQYQDTLESMDAGGSYMGDATVAPTNYPPQHHPMPLSQRRPMEVTVNVYVYIYHATRLGYLPICLAVCVPSRVGVHLCIMYVSKSAESVW